MPPLKPKILFEDQHLMLLSKPAGLLSQGEEKGEMNVVDWARSYLGRNYVGLVHRLDRNTSGLMVVAKRSKSADRLTQSLQKGSLKRSYLALLQGELNGEKKWRHFLKKNEEKNKVDILRSPPPDSAKGEWKEASLSVQGISLHKYQGEVLSLVRFDLETGRGHQIRVQAAFENYPLIGDAKYGSKKLSEAFLKFPRQALHSAEISFPHPMPPHALLSFKDELPSDMKALLK